MGLPTYLLLKARKATYVYVWRSVMSQHECEKLGESCQSGALSELNNTGRTKNGLRMKFLTVHRCTTITVFFYTKTAYTSLINKNEKERSNHNST